ncbi:hypothetical protein B0H34DRAFT_821131 [Crassisporium funariophilum]|nr:hypothetical protein B0H34DRAFT_821131 [Crassisporium funariophilum]
MNHSSSTDPTSSDNKLSRVVKALHDNGNKGFSKSLLKPYTIALRWISQSISVAEYEEDSDANEFSDEERRVFAAIMSLHPGFKALVMACKDDPSALESLAKKVNEASEASRSCDTANIKKAIFGYIFENPYQGSHWVEIVQEPLVPGDDKGARGFHHVETAALLCPLRLLDEFEEDPNIFMMSVQDSNIDITADDLPTFLYESGTSYNEDDECTGLSQGHVLVRVYQHLFTGERSALNPKGGATKNKSRKFKLEEVTPRTIAYASVQTYIALASMPQWGRNDKSLFDLEDFYENIVDMFEGNADAPWVIETLEWWNEQVPGLCPKSSKVKKNKLAGSRIRTRPRPADRITAHLQQNPVLNQHVKSGTTQTLDRQGHEMHQEKNRLHQSTR